MLRIKNWRATAAVAVGAALFGVCAAAQAQDEAYALAVAYIDETPTATASSTPRALLAAPAPRLSFDIAGVRPAPLNTTPLDTTPMGPANRAPESAADAAPPLAFSLDRTGASASAVYAEWRMSPAAGFCGETGCGAANPENDDALLLRVGADDFGLRVGAQARVAERLSSLVSEGGRSRWYFFFAADAEALTWTPGKRQQQEDDQSVFTLGEMKLVGDAQAGIGARVRGGDIAVGYVGREVSHLGAERRENFLGLTYSWSG